MAKGKKSSSRPQQQHKKSRKSQHEKRQRLDRHNPARRKTVEPRVPLVGAMQTAVSALKMVLDRRMAFRLAIIVSGMLLAADRRTASAWFVAAGVQEDWDRFYDALISIGRTSAKLATHPLWGTIALPLMSKLYVREVDVPQLAEKYGWKFRTKHQLGVDLLSWFMKSIRALGVEAQVWLAVDGAYAARPFLKPTLELGIVVVSRLRKDAHLRDLPGERDPHKRGRHPIYGENRISLAKRAAHTQGWETISYLCRGVEVTRQYKTFLATSELTSGVIRVVVLRFDDGGWAPYFCTDSSASVREILEAVAARWAIEEHFHDVKEVWGAGQQQVRNIWSNIGCWHLNQWLYTLVELCSWDAEKSELTDRGDRPWDNPDRRPSHSDRRRCIAREMLHNQLAAALQKQPDTLQLQTLFQSLVALAT
jgi:hypothetical protein